MHVEVGASENAWTTFARDQLLLLRCAADSQGRARIWRRPAPGLLLGRFHRVDASSLATTQADGDSGLSRRLSGGRVIPVGPGVVCLTMAAPVVNWFDPMSSALRPEQVLNRALRPLLAMFREDGLDAFYPGRDLLTVAGRPLAHASFTVMRDGVAVVEMQVSETAPWSNLPDLLDRYDPEGVAGVERDGFRDGISVEGAHGHPRRDAEWATRFARCAAASFGCDAEVGNAAPPPSEHSPASGEAAELTMASQRAAQDFLAQPATPPPDFLSAAAVSMLGMVECSGRMHGDRLRDLCITGDVLAPFHTLDDLAAACEGQPFRAANIRKALARVMAQPRSFVLGVTDLDELLLRLA